MLPASVDTLLVDCAGIYSADCIDYVRRMVEKICEMELDVEWRALADIKRIAEQDHVDPRKRVLGIMYRIGALMDECRRLAN
jgi:hypothetical protein